MTAWKRWFHIRLILFCVFISFDFNTKFVALYPPNEVLGEKKTLNIDLSKLIAKGFDNDYLTHQKPSRFKGDMYYYVFDFGYKIIDDTTVMVLKVFQ